MRIQETNEILKESRHARQPVKQHHPGMLARAWKMISGLFKK
jgi:hypothetical protein